MNKDFTTIIVITPKDFPRLKKHYKRLVDSIPSRDFVFVSSEGIKAELDAANLGSNVTFIDENKLITFDEVNQCMAKHLEPILHGEPVPRGATGWYYQQFLKMQYAHICQDEFYMTWDGDTIPCKPFSMFQEESGSPYLDMKSEYHELYFQTIEKLLPGMRKALAKSFISEHMLFHVDMMKKLIERIESNDAIAGTRFWEKIINAIPPEKISESGFSEFETYGTFVCFTDPYMYKLRDWHSFRLAGEFFDPATICERDFEWLSKDFHAISFEKNHFVREDNKNLFDNPEYQKKLSARKMLEIAQEEFNGGYIEVWGENDGRNGEDPLASKANISTPAKAATVYEDINQIPEDVIYDRLGDEKLVSNINQAYLCYENAEFLCTDENRKSIYKKKKDNLFSTGKIKVNKTAFCIVSYNCKEYMIECIKSISEHCAPESYSIIVTDNASTDGVRDYLLEISDDITLVLSDENLGFPGGSNACIQYAEKDYDIFLLNNDTRMTHNALFWLRMGLYEAEDVGAAGCIGSFAGNDQLINLGYSNPEKYMEFAKTQNIPSDNPYEEKSRLCGFAMMIKRSVIDKVGVLDEAFAPGYFEDDDLSLRISEAGYRLIVVHNSFIFHKGSESTNQRKREQALSNGDNTVIKDMHAFVERNYHYIQEKHGYNTFFDAIITFCEKDTVKEITHNKNEHFSLLEINAGAGNYLTMIKYLYPNASVYGIDSNYKGIRKTVKSVPILLLNPVNDRIPFPDRAFDYIVVKSTNNNLFRFTEEEAHARYDYLLKENGKLLYVPE